MAVGKEIRTKIKSIKNTQKITSAMQMVASSKMRKTQQQMLSSRPYAHQIFKLVSHLAQANIDFEHVYLTKRETKRVGVIVISSDRGLCGGLNNNLFKHLSLKMREWSEENKEVSFVTFGKKANAFFSRFGGKVLATASGLGDSPTMAELLGPINVMLKAYRDGDVDEVHVFTNLFVNTMVQKPVDIPMLPLDVNKFKQLEEEMGYSSLEEGEENTELPIKRSSGLRWDYIYDMNPERLIDLILSRYLESGIYHAVVENIACEMAARMMAMQAATDNADALVNNLQLAYNKARQAAITQEISEIVGGAAALG